MTGLHLRFEPSDDPDGAPLYPGLCRGLSAPEIDRRMSAGERACLRLDMDRALSAAAIRRAGADLILTYFAIDDLVTIPEPGAAALIGLGLNNTEIAGRLHLSTSTVKTHVGSVLAKTDSRDRVQAALLASRAGLMPS